MHRLPLRSLLSLRRMAATTPPPPSAVLLAALVVGASWMLPAVAADSVVYVDGAKAVEVSAPGAFRGADLLAHATPCTGDCAGHGNCDVGRAVCVCFANDVDGHWDAATHCVGCKEGFFGEDCTRECPGGSCFQCTNRGVCHDGRYGNGTCTCEGAYVGEACDRCRTGWYGVGCTLECPGGAAAPCNGRGTCRDGPAGDGVCECLASPSHGYWGSDTACRDCDAAHWGALCTKECVGGSKPCSGHGACGSGTGGDGQCTCSLGWTGSACSIACPGSTATHVCSGNGVCRADGTCQCTGANVRGKGCEECVVGKTGPTCDDNCVTGTGGVVCSGNGECARDGSCVCKAGFGHDTSPGAPQACQMRCANSDDSMVCSGNGACDVPTAECKCADAAAEGHWSGRGCEVCKGGWSGRGSRSERGCSLECPGGEANPCTGRGECIEGKCFCEPGFCGASCETAGDTCSQCPKGTWSRVGEPECARTCACSGKGRCLERKDVASGSANACECHPGYGLADCSKSCPMAGTTPCGGFARGACDVTGTLTCTCRTGYGGDACETACPRDAAGRACTGNTCFDNEYVKANGMLPPGATLGQCDCRAACQMAGKPSGCAQGFVGLACLTPCKCQAAFEDGALRATGYCEQDGSCTCDGDFAGPACADCKDGFFGLTCNQTCGVALASTRTGRSVARGCECIESWFGKDCSKACPGIEPTTGAAAAGGVCSGHGRCNWGEDGSGLCACDEGFFGAECFYACDAAKCAHLKNWMCTDAGECACRDDLREHWGNLPGGCDECKKGWWGARCDSACDCSMHGTCDRLTGGACTCFADSVKGHWSGRRCERCADGYIGLECTGQSVPISRAGTIDPRVPLEKPRALYADEDEGFIYAGGSPLTALSVRLEPGATASYARLEAQSGTALGCNAASVGEAVYVTAHKEAVYIVVQPEPGKGCSRFRVLAMPRRGGAVKFASARTQHTGGSHAAAGMRVVSVDKRGGDGAGAAYLFVLLGPADPSAPPRYAVDVVPLSGAVGGVPAPRFFCYPSTDRIGQLFDTVASITADDNLSRFFLSGTAAGGTAWAAAEFAASPDAGAAASQPCDARYAAVDEDTRRLIVYNAAKFPPGGPCEDVPCDSAAAARYYNGTLLLVVNGGKGAGLMQINLCPSCKWVTITLTRERQVVSGMEVDKWGERLYVAAHKGAEPTVLRRFRFHKQTVKITRLEPGSRTIVDVDELHYYPVLYAELAMTQSITSNGFAAEVIPTMFAADRWRLLYGLLSGGGVLRLATFVMYEVATIYPPVADVQGGTVVTVTGHGFREVAHVGAGAVGVYRPSCRFGNSARFQSAELRGRSRLLCSADNTNTTEPQCGGDPVEITMYSSTATLTDNGVRILRLASASVEAASPAGGHFTGIRQNTKERIVVTLTGYSFDQYATCPECLAVAFYDASSPPKRYLSQGTAMVTYVSQNEVRCLQPGADQGVAGASMNPSFLDVTIDGQVFSGNPIPYVLRGDPHTIVTNHGPEVVSVHAMPFMKVPPMAVWVVDEMGHRLGEADTESRVIEMTLTSYVSQDTREPVTYTTGTAPLNNPDVNKKATHFSIPSMECTTGTVGQCTFDNTAIDWPLTGELVIGFKLKPAAGSPAREAAVLAVPAAVAWVSGVHFKVTEGMPAGLKLQRQPSRVIPAALLLTEQPRLVLADLMGNDVVDYDGGHLVASATLVSEPAGHGGGQKFYSLQQGASTGLLLYEKVAIKASFGPTYYLNFTIPGSPNFGWVMSQPMERERCRPDQYAFLWTTHCAPCPSPGGICNGTEVVLSKPGYWRENQNTSTIYKCSTSSTCLGGVSGAAQACSNETMGPQCSVCREGYGLQPGGTCSKCNAEGVNLAIISVVFFFVLIALVGWIIYTLGIAYDKPYTVISRMLVTHLQMSEVGKFSENWSAFTKSLFDTQKSGSTLSISGFSALDCLLRNKGYNYFHYFKGYMALPMLPFLIAVLVYTYIVVRRTINPSLAEEGSCDSSSDESSDQEMAEAQSDGGLGAREDTNFSLGQSLRDSISVGSTASRRGAGGSQLKDGLTAKDEDTSLEDNRNENNIFSYKFPQVCWVVGLVVRLSGGFFCTSTPTHTYRCCSPRTACVSSSCTRRSSRKQLP